MTRVLMVHLSDTCRRPEPAVLRCACRASPQANPAGGPIEVPGEQKAEAAVGAPAWGIGVGG
jgi:hypothetical protein